MDPVKEVVGVSIGSSKRDHIVEMELIGQPIRIQRRGTDGDMNAAVAILKELDGKADAFGIGGLDMFLRVAGKDYYFRDAKRYRDAPKLTPIVCGSGLKGAVEADVVRFMAEDLGLELAGKRVLMTSAVDRWGMAEGFWGAGCDVWCGDLLFALGIDKMIKSRKWTERTARALMPIVRQLPFKWLYDSTADHQSEVPDKHPELYRWADIVAGDYKYVRKWMPKDMGGKWVVTNTTTPEDVDFLRERGVELLITSTPRLEGRSFGTNVIEATMVALKGAKGPLTSAEYMELLGEAGFSPDVMWLQKSPTSAGGETLRSAAVQPDH